LREEYRLRVFENRVLRRIFGPKRDLVRGEWRKLHNEELYVLYFIPDIIRVIIGFWRENLREEDHVEDSGIDGRVMIKYIFEMVRGMDWIDLTQDRDRWRAVVNAVMNLRVSQNAGNFLSSLGRVIFSGKTQLYGVN
jgi:hypothetical protein